MKTKIYRT